MSGKTTRRQFIRQSATAGVGFWVSNEWARGEPAVTRSANEKVNVAIVGCGGQGSWNTRQVAESGMANLVALVDVDENRCAETRAAFPKVPFHVDYRRVLERKDVDAVLVATPDHTHVGPTLMALRAGKHVYSEKPLCHTVEEVRLVTETARKAGVATQMGTQIHSLDNYRRVVELVKTGAIGPIREVHVWVDRQWGGQTRPKDTPAVPEGLHYDLWIGPAAYRPYHPDYLPGKWRGWWDFGGGTLADMACHHMDLPFWALDLRVPRTIEAEGPPVHAESCQKTLTVRYEFDARGQLPPAALTWYHGGLRPPHFNQGAKVKLPEWDDGTLFVGEKGLLLAGYQDHKLLPEDRFKDFTRPEPFIKSSPGHHKEWLEACKGGKPALCSFDYAGPLSEAVLLGNVAYRTGKKLIWNAKTMKTQGVPKADTLIRKAYRKGWELG